MTQEFSLQNNDIVGISAILSSTILSAYIHIIFKKIIIRHTKEALIFYQCIAGAFIFLPFILINNPVPN